MNRKDKKPPRTAEFYLHLLLPEREKHDLLGDYAEYYREISDRKGHFIAGLWYWTQIAMLIPGSIWISTKWSLVMIRNYLKIAVRTIKRYKSYSFINIVGLALGMVCCLFILIYVLYEFSYDSFHENG